jgi:hypothetical protein
MAVPQALIAYDDWPTLYRGLQLDRALHGK